MSWCSLERPVRSQNLSWAATEDGDCVSVKYGPNATSTFTKTACDKQIPFICEVRHFNLYNPYKSSYEFIGEKFCVYYPNISGAQQGIICAGLTG
jgi:hypothetical protein